MGRVRGWAADAIHRKRQNDRKNPHPQKTRVGHPFGCWLVIVMCFAGGCSRRAAHDPSTVVFLIESGPTNLDPRYGTDGQSQRIDRLLFDGLVQRDTQMNLQGDFAEKWENPDPLTYIFHLQTGSEIPRWADANFAGCEGDD